MEESVKGNDVLVCPSFDYLFEQQERKSIKHKHFLTLKDFSEKEIGYLLMLSFYLKNKRKNLKAKRRVGVKGYCKPNDELLLLEGKSVVLIFEKESTRTRCSFEVACGDEGCSTVTYLSSDACHIGLKESAEDTIKVLSRYYDGAEFRGHSHSIIEEMALHSTVPIWNGLTDSYHPTQVLADFLTIMEWFNLPWHGLKGLKFVFMGDTSNNMCASLMIGSAKMGVHFIACGPNDLAPPQTLQRYVEMECLKSGGSFVQESNPSVAVSSADVVYTDVWVSMGESADAWEKKVPMLLKYQVNAALLKSTGKANTIFMHCLPAFHDDKTSTGKKAFEKYGIKELEVTDEVFRGCNSVVNDQAENRLHTIKAVMVSTISDIL